MTELETLTIREVIDGLADRAQTEFGMKNRKLAKSLVLNALTYNIVIEEILDQIAWMVEHGEVWK